MSKFDNEIISTIAYAEVDGRDEDAGGPVYITNRGFTDVIDRNGAGDYTHTLDITRPGNGGLDDDVMGVFVSGKGAIPFLISSEHQSPTQVRVHMLEATHLEGFDGDYYLRVVRVTNSFT